MKFEYTGRHIEVTPALKAHVEEQFKKVEHIFNGKPAKAHVIIEVERGRHRSEVILNWRKETITATTTNSDMYLSLSQTIAKLEKQALKIKKKVIDKAHKAKRSAVVAERRTESRVDVRRPRIIQARKYVVKPVAPEEAVMLLEQDSKDFLVFRNAENQKIAVIYKRSDGNFGLIQP